MLTLARRITTFAAPCRKLKGEGVRTPFAAVLRCSTRNHSAYAMNRLSQFVNCQIQAEWLDWIKIRHVCLVSHPDMQQAGVPIGKKRSASEAAVLLFARSTDCLLAKY